MHKKCVLVVCFLLSEQAVRASELSETVVGGVRQHVSVVCPKARRVGSFPGAISCTPFVFNQVESQEDNNVQYVEPGSGQRVSITPDQLSAMHCNAQGNNSLKKLALQNSVRSESKQWEYVTPSQLAEMQKHQLKCSRVPDKPIPRVKDFVAVMRKMRIDSEEPAYREKMKRLKADSLNRKAARLKAKEEQERLKAE